MIQQLRALRKFILFIFLSASYIAYSYFGRWIVHSASGRRRFHAKTVTFFTRKACQVIGIRTRYLNAPRAEQNFLFVGNHLGFLDILVLSSMRPTLFVTSVEMRETPFLGLLCEMGGCHFVERRSRSGLVKEIEEIRNTLQEGFSVAIYPEGTSGDGTKVLPIKKSLLLAAAASGVAIKVMVINYRKVDGHKVEGKWRDYVCWYGDLSFLPAIWRLFTLKTVDVDLSFHDEIHVSSEDDRRELAAQVQSILEKHYDPIVV